MRDLNNLKEFMESPDLNRKEIVEFFNKHDQYWKKAVFLDLLDFYYATADTMAELITAGIEPDET